MVVKLLFNASADIDHTVQRFFHFFQIRFFPFIPAGRKDTGQKQQEKNIISSWLLHKTYKTLKTSNI